MLDFNDAPGSKARKAPEDGAAAAREKDEIRAALNDQLPLLALDIWPSGPPRQNSCRIQFSADDPQSSDKDKCKT